MSPVIRISDATYTRLQKLAVPFTDKPETVIERLLDRHEKELENELVSERSFPRKTAVQELGTQSVQTFVSQVSPSETSGSPVPSGTNGLLPLAVLRQRDLSKQKPTLIEIEGHQTAVRSWGDLCETFVMWLIQNQRLDHSQLPILNHSQRDKYFINSKPEHLDATKDGSWREVSGVYIDIKYSAGDHVKNLEAALSQLREPVPKVQIALRSSAVNGSGGGRINNV